jgi:hypothetical protein
MHFENLNNAGNGRVTPPLPDAICMLWPWLEAYPEQVNHAWSRLHSILANANRLWNEPETTRKVIVPILTELLGFPQTSLARRLFRYGTRARRRYFQTSRCPAHA